VLDPFGGSGTTLIAAERTGRRARLIELDPKYVDVAVQRWEEQSGQSARLQQSGKSFSEMAANRHDASPALNV
jgi:DNA modification methylase